MENYSSILHKVVGNCCGFTLVMTLMINTTTSLLPLPWFTHVVLTLCELQILDLEFNAYSFLQYYKQ